MKRFQNIFSFLVPSWLSEGEGGLVLASLGLIKDAFLERAEQGLDARFPTRTGPSALALIGDDRGIVRGRSETIEQYARRLIAWRYPRGHRTRGSAFALLSQVVAYWGDAITFANTIDKSSNLHVTLADGTESYFYGAITWNWDGTPISPNWARFWLGITVSATSGIGAWPDFDDPELWGGALNADVCVGIRGITPDDARAMRRLFTGRAWKPAGTRAEWLIVNLDGSAPASDGTWGTWSRNVAGTQTATRPAGWRFVALTAVLNEYAGNAANWPDDYDAPGGGTYAGTSAWADEITLVDGSTYAGDSATFTTPTLPDDGSPAD